MERQNINDHFEQYLNDFNRSVYHPILERDIGQPNLAKHILFFLLLPKLNGERWTSETNLAAIAVGAVYKAFDAHDEVDVYKVTSTEQQLKVLSGDFLSGIYYRLIASTSNFEFIHKMSSTIGRMNELKTELHSNAQISKEAYAKIIQEVQSDCIIQFLNSFGFEQYVPLARTALPFISLMHVKDGTEKLSNSWVFSHDFAEETIRTFRTLMDEELKKAHFLSPLLIKEIEEMTLPLIGKKM